VVPTDASHVSRASIDGDRRDAWDASERIYDVFLSTGGRKVAGSNPVAPIQTADCRWCSYLCQDCRWRDCRRRRDTHGPEESLNGEPDLTH
jgi:hypothetical protein